MFYCLKLVEQETLNLLRMNKSVEDIYWDEQSIEVNDIFNDSYGIYVNICQQCRFQQLGYDDLSTSPQQFYCNSCWDQFNSSSINHFDDEKIKVLTNKKRIIDENAAMEYFNTYHNHSKKKKDYQERNCKVITKRMIKTKRKKCVIVNVLDYDRIKVIIQQYYRIHHNNWHNKLKCLIDDDKLEQLKDEYINGENDWYLVYSHDPIICKFNWYCHTLLISGFCNNNDNKLFIPDTITIMCWKYYSGFTGFDIKQRDSLDAKIQIEKKLKNINYMYKPKWYEKEMIIALVYNHQNHQNHRKNKKWPRHITMCQVLPIYKMVNN